MSVNSITASPSPATAEYNLKPVAVSVDQAAKSAPANDQSANKAVTPEVVDAKSVNNVKEIVDLKSVNKISEVAVAKDVNKVSDVTDAKDINKVLEAKKQQADAAIESRKEPVRAMSHVIQSYNQQGELRTKFMDSNNNLIYQIPSEMVAKIQDLMMKPKVSPDARG